MPTTQDELFAKAVIEKKIASREEIEQAFMEMKQAERIGAQVSLDAVLVKKGLIGRAEADTLLKTVATRKIPRVIGGFEILEEIGRGGMGTVYRARQVSMDRQVALKVLPPNLARDKGYIERFHKEARAVARLSHVNIIQGYDVGNASGYYYFAMEFVDGESTAERLKRCKQFGEVEALGIVEQIARALAHAHGVGRMIHRDIKPDNIMLAKNGVVKLADLGLAKTIGESSDFSAGSPHYISPEQGQLRDDIDIRSDIYSLGATLYHMVTGQPPFNGSTADIIIAKHINEELPSPRSINPSLSLNLCRLLSTMLAKNPAERYQTPDEVLQDVRLVREGLPPQKAVKLGIGSSSSGSSAKLAERSESESTRTAIVVGIMVLAALIVAGSFMLGGSDKNSSGGNTTGGITQPAAAERALQEADAFEKSNPGNPHEIIRRYDTVAEEYADVAEGRDAARRAAALRLRLTEQARRSLAERRAEAQKLVQQERYADAQSALDEFPASFHFGVFAEQIASEKKAINEKASARARELYQQARTQAGQHRYDEAIEALRTLLAFGPSDQTARIEADIRNYTEAKEQRAERERQAAIERAQQAYEAAVDRSLTLAIGRQFDEALEICDAYTAEHGVPEGTDMRRIREDIALVSEIWTTAIEALHRQQGRAVSIRARGIGLQGTLRRITDETFTVEMAGANHTRAIADIDIDSILTLAGIMGEGHSVMDRRIRAYVTSGLFDRAQQAVQELDEDKRGEWVDYIEQRQTILADK